MSTPVFAQENCSGDIDFDTIEIASLACNSIALIITILIGTIAIKQLETMEQICIILKSLVYISIVSAAISLSSSVLITIACSLNQHLVAEILMIFTICGYLALILSLLLTLITRLYYTFLASVYRMSNVERNVYSFVYILIVLLSCCSLGFNIALVTIDQVQNPKKHRTILLAGMFCFIAAALL